MGFTLIELLVVIAIIALLISILVPVLSAARKQGRSVACMNNLRQFGVATQSYEDGNDGFLPAEGMADGDISSHPIGPWDDPSFWANALPPIIDASAKSYADLQQRHMSGGEKLPGAGANNPFVCRDASPAGFGATSAEVSGGYFMMWGLKPGATSISAPHERRPTYWCYAYNSGLDNIAAKKAAADDFGTCHLKTSCFNVQPAMIPMLVEKMMNPDEISPKFTSSLNRAKTKANAPGSCRLASRHRGGGFLLMMDAHVELVSRGDATTDVNADGTYNRPGIMWQPN
ncbi:MAG TPA: type II secretion system protein [Phycisphaerae bacterium]|nr:type II secretion system protein [Phycisphaerae bacterium]